MVVGDHHPDCHGTGTRAVSAVPCPGTLSMSTVPPSSATRSRMWASPEPACGAAGLKPVPVSHGKLDVTVVAGHGHGKAYARGDGEVTVIPTDAWAGGLAAATVIGALAGLLPAIRAARLSPTQALWSI